jgi:hypothetical protein
MKSILQNELMISHSMAHLIFPKLGSVAVELFALWNTNWHVQLSNAKFERRTLRECMTPVITIKSSSTSWIINTRYAQGKQKMFKVPVARPFEVAVNPLFSLIACLLASLHSDSAPPRVCGSAGEARVCHLHARSIFLSHSLTRGCVFYKFSSSKNNERARHVLSGKRTWHYFSTARWCTHECASARYILLHHKAAKQQ